MKKYLLIDTKYINTTNKYNFRYYLPNSINIKKYLKISYLYMPRMNYMINSNNNMFKIIFHVPYGENPQEVNFLEQVYTPLSLVEAIRTRLAPYYNFNIIYNQFTYKIEMSCDVKFDLDFTNSNFHNLIGLDKKLYSSIDNKFITNCINFNQPSYITINFQNITTNNLISNNPSIQSNFIIPLGSKVLFGEILSYTKDLYDVEMSVDNINLHYLDIVILDDNNNEFQNNNSNWYCLLEFI